MSLLDNVTAQAGPLKVWQWGILGGAAVLILTLLRGRGSGNVRQPLTVVPLLDFSGKSPPAGLLGGLLDELTDFICMLPNAPNQLALQTPDGSVLSIMNGIPTFGPGAAVLTGPDGIQSASAGWNPCKPAEVAPDDGGEPPPIVPPQYPPGTQWIGSGPGLLPYIPWPAGTQPGTVFPAGYNPATKLFETLNYPLAIGVAPITGYLDPNNPDVAYI